MSNLSRALLLTDNCLVSFGSCVVLSHFHPITQLVSSQADKQTESFINEFRVSCPTTQQQHDMQPQHSPSFIGP